MNNSKDIINNKLEQAIFYAEKMHWNVIPIGIDKKPLIEWKKFQKERVTLDQIKEWFAKYPTANIGIVTGKISNLLVADIDPRHDGSDQEFKAIQTVNCRTGGGGWHYYFQYIEGVQNGAGIKPGIDLRGEGGYVIAPPSSHQSGNNYEWLIDPKDGEVIDLPDAIRAWLVPLKNGTKSNWSAKVLKGVGAGNRNQSAASVAGKLLATFPKKEWETEAWEHFKNWNNKNQPPLIESELRSVFESIAKKEVSKKGDAAKELDPCLFEKATLNEALESVEQILPGKKQLVLLALAVSISHLVDTKTPLWLMFVGVPSSAKTEVARMLSFNPVVFFLDTLTENAFVSGAKNQNGSDPTDLLPLLNGKCFVIKDFTTTLSQREETVRKIQGDLTSIYDDTFSKHSPARGTITYHSFFSVLGCVTPQALNRHQRYMNQIGPRFLFYRVPSSDDEQVEHAFDTLWSADKSRSKWQEAQKKVSAYAYQLANRIDEIVLEKEDEDIIKYLNSLAKFIANARGIVLTRSAEFLNEEGDKISFYEPVEIQIEEPFRALLQLRVLARSLAVVNGKNTVTFEELDLVRKVALSSMPADRSLLLSVIGSEDRSWSAKEISDKLGVSHKTALRQSDELVSLKILSKTEQGGGLANLYTVSQGFHTLLYTDVEFLSHPSPTETQTPHRGNGIMVNEDQKIEDLSEDQQLKLVKDEFGKESRWSDE